MELHEDETSSCLIILAFLFLVLCKVTGFLVALIVVGHHIRDQELKERVQLCVYAVFLGLQMAFYTKFIKTVKHSFIEHDLRENSLDPFDEGRSFDLRH
jgi:type III secretory pathway component EscS